MRVYLTERSYCRDLRGQCRHDQNERSRHVGHDIPDEGGLAYWDNLLNSGTLTRENVNWWFCESAEWQGIKASYDMK